MPTNTDSSSGFANEPIVNLLKRPLNQLSQEELRAYTQELRTLRTSPQALGKRLRAEAADKEEREDRAEAKGQAKSLDDLMKDLEG